MGNARARVREAAARGRTVSTDRMRSPASREIPHLVALIAVGKKVASESPTQDFRGYLSATVLHTLTHDHR